MHLKPFATPEGVGVVSLEPIRLAGLVSAFDQHPTIRIKTGELEFLLKDLSLHYLILDVSCNSAWIDVQYRVRRTRPEMRQIVLGPAGDEELILRSLTAGARAYLDANCGPLAVRQAVEAVMQGTIWAPRRLLSILIDRLMAQTGAGLEAPSPVLSPRERQVLDLIMTARSNREIAMELGIEERTVKAYVASLLRKLGSENRVSLSVQATQDSLREAMRDAARDLMSESRPNLAGDRNLLIS
jgi:DNA-binding NarL/FixJ family response regulator